MLVCFESETEKEYTTCMTTVQQKLMNTQFGKALGAKAAGKISSKKWTNKEKRETSIVDIKQHITQYKSIIECANNPDTTDYAACI